MRKKHLFVSIILVIMAMVFIWFILGDNFFYYLPKLGGYFCLLLLFVFIISGTFSGSRAFNKSKEI